MEVLQATGETVRPRLMELLETTKPRIGAMVVLTTLVGYTMASNGPLDPVRLVMTLVGTALSAAGSCALNQYLERDLDRKMQRTRNRPIPAGRVSAEDVRLFGILLSASGVVLLASQVNTLTAILSASSVLGYIFVYTPLKRVTPLNTVVGAVAGGLPPVLGWTAAVGDWGLGASLLFCVQFLWQLPHFMAIAILYRDDYAAGGFQMLPVVEKNPRRIAGKIIGYTWLLVLSTFLPVITGMAGSAYAVAAMVLGGAFLYQAVLTSLMQTRENATRLLLASLIYLPVLFLVMIADKM